MSHPNGGSARCVFFSFLVISAWFEGHDEMVFTTGVLNWSVALSGASVREKPDEEKSVQVKVWRFAVRD